MSTATVQNLTSMFLVSFCINCELDDFYFFIKTEDHGVC